MIKNRLILLGMISTFIISCACPWIPFLSPIPTMTPEETKIIGFQTEVVSVFPPDSSPFSYNWEDLEPFRANLTSLSYPVLAGLPGATIYHISLKFEDPPNRVAGVEEIQYTNTETVSLEEIDFALFPELLGGNLLIQEITIEGIPGTPILEGWLMRFPLAHPLHPGERITFHIEFEVEIPHEGGEYYYGIFGYNNGIISFAHAYPTVLVYNQEGWNNQKPDLDGDPLFADISFFLVSIEAPSNLVLVTSGVELMRYEISDQQKVLIANGPARDFYLAASSGWLKQSKSIGDTIVNSYAPSDFESASMAALDFGLEAMKIFSARYGTYPYTEFDIVPIVTAAGGVEYPGLTSISEQMYSWDEFLEIVIVHEIAHMWFYNLVGNDTQDQPWLDESFSQFATWQYFLDRYGEESAELFAQIDLRGTWAMAENPFSPIGLSVSAYPGADYSAVIYGRGPLFLIALRDEIGADTFDLLMRDYVKEYSWAIVSTEEFKNLAEEECVCDLTLLFDEWVYP